MQFGCAVFRGRLYAVGGSDGAVILNTVESFDPADRGAGWRLEKSMKYKRSGLGLCVFEDRLWAVGGWSGTEELAGGSPCMFCVHRFDRLWRAEQVVKR